MEATAKELLEERKMALGFWMRYKSNTIT
jgi:hypothetical protein